MSTEAVAVVRAVVADCFLDGWHVEIASDKRVRHIPWCVHDLTEGFRLETLEDFDVGCGSRTPQLDSISPDRYVRVFFIMARVLFYYKFRPTWAMYGYGYVMITDPIELHTAVF
jgi:hypothetical protein